MRRRQFLATTAAATASAAALPWRSLLAAPAPARIHPFALSQIRLRPGPMLDAAEVNRRFVLGQDPDRLLHNFRVNAGLPSSAAPLGGWEAPNNELRGHFVGHYLSACAMIWASMGDAAAKQRGDKIVAVLAECQKARGSGYLSHQQRRRLERRPGHPLDRAERLHPGVLRHLQHPRVIDSRPPRRFLFDSEVTGEYV